MVFFRVPYFTLQFNLGDNDLLSKCKHAEHVLAFTHKVFSHSAVPLKSPPPHLIKAAGAKQFASVLAQTEDEGNTELYMHHNSLSSTTLQEGDQVGSFHQTFTC